MDGITYTFEGIVENFSKRGFQDEFGSVVCELLEMSIGEDVEWWITPSDTVKFSRIA